MEEEKDRSFTTPAPKRRQPIKSNLHTYPIWKQKLRENCYKRVREERARLLWKMRSPASVSLDDKELIRSACRDIVSNELKKLRGSSLDAPLKGASSPFEVDDLLWEYDGLHDAYEGECEDMLLEMQRLFYEDLRGDPNKPESCVKTWEDEEDEYLACAVFEHMKLTDEQITALSSLKQETCWEVSSVTKKVTTTWCPICKQGALKEDSKLLYCSHCELRLTKCDEVNLDKLRTRLGEAHMEHLDRGCRSKPKFCVETRFGLTALYISCQACNIFEVVM